MTCCGFKSCGRSVALEPLFASEDASADDDELLPGPAGGPLPGMACQNVAPSYRKELDKKNRQLQRKGQARFECTSDPN